MTAIASPGSDTGPSIRAVLALSGGGAKAAAHLGAARALSEAQIRPLRYVGTSMGAVVAAALAAAGDPDALLDRFAAVAARGIVRERLSPVLGLFSRGLLKPLALRQAIESFVGVGRFRDLSVPLTITATDLDTGAIVLFGEGGQDAPLADALMASCALPIYFPPVVLGGRRFGDGGLRGVLPLEAALAVARVTSSTHVIAVDVGPGFDSPEGEAPRMPPVLRAHDEATGILMAALTREQLTAWGADPSRPRLLYVRPSIERFTTFRVEHSADFSDAGYRAARGVLAELRT